VTYRRALENCMFRVYRFSAAHVLVVDSDDRARVEILTTTPTPIWVHRSRQLTRHEAATIIRKAATIAPTFKPVYLQMLAAKEKEACRG